MVNNANLKKPAYTLIELVIGLFLIFVFGFAVFSIMQNIIRYDELDQALSGFNSSIRLAQANAMSGKGDSGWGVKVISGNIIVYKGDDFETRDIQFDVDTFISKEIEVSGNNEIKFSKYSGVASVLEANMPAVFSFRYQENTTNLSITAKGGINY